MNNSIYKYLIVIFFLAFSLAGYSQQNSDAEMQALLKEKRITNSKSEEIIGFRIQLYNGLNEKRATNLKARFAAKFPYISTRLFYKQPEWKVHAGNYRTKLEAYRVLTKIREEFEGAFILKTKINI